GSLNIRGGSNSCRQHDIGQVVRVDVRGRDGLGQFRTTNPQANLTASVCKHFGQRGSPGSRAHHCNLCHSSTFLTTCLSHPIIKHAWPSPGLFARQGLRYEGAHHPRRSRKWPQHPRLKTCMKLIKTSNRNLSYLAAYSMFPKTPRQNSSAPPWQQVPCYGAATRKHLRWR